MESILCCFHVFHFEAYLTKINREIWTSGSDSTVWKLKFGINSSKNNLRMFIRLPLCLVRNNRVTEINY